jgi:hypothetical protein
MLNFSTELLMHCMGANAPGLQDGVFLQCAARISALPRLIAGFAFFIGR